MPKRILTGLGLFTFLFLSVSPVLANPDTYIKAHTHTDAMTMFGRTISPAKDIYTVTWMSGDKARMDNYDNKGKLTDSTIWWGDKGKMYIIDHARRTYQEMDFPVDIAGIPSIMKMTVKVTPTSESKKIKNWKCRKYVAEMEMVIGSVTSTTTHEIWASEDISIDYSLYMKLSQAAQSAAGLSISEDVTKEWGKVKGYPVLTTMTITTMGQSIKSSTELLEYNSKRSAPKGTYDVPRGYTNKPIHNSM